MPAFSFHLFRFLRSWRSHSSNPSPTGPCDDAAAAQSPYLDPSPAGSSQPSSMCSALEQDAVAATGTSRLPASSNLTPPQNSTERLCADKAQRDLSDKPSQVLLPITQMSVVNSTPAPTASPCSSVAQVPARLPAIHVPTDSIQSQQFLLPQQSSLYTLATASQQLLVPEQQSHKYSPQLQDRNQGMFHQPRNFSAMGNFIDGNVGSVVYITAPPSNQFMEKLLKEAIPGAASDSSARYPPPRCHPGTRLAVLERCLQFIALCNGEKKMRWVVGTAGVGKSAIMQSVTESGPELTVTSNASVFFSINGRNDGTKAIMTLSYQFAAKSATYRQVIEDEITRDPSLLQSSMPVQFERFIVQPFIHSHHFNSAGRVLIIIDGLDECYNTDMQVELLRLISNLCISYPSSPIIWLIASRPETHITSFFSRAEIMPAYEKEEILVDSDEARADVEQFLRAELTEIGKKSDFLSLHWPDEQQIWKLAEAAGGLFAYAQTVIRYIGDSTMGDPASQLSDVLNVIDEHPMLDVPPEEHPMALLDALYAQILSNIPSKIMGNTRKLLLLLASDRDLALLKSGDDNFIVLCNWLGMTANEAYAAVNRLRSVLHFPQRNEAHMELPSAFHKSFIDYISRSGFFTNIKLEAQQLKTRCAFRVLKEAPSGIDFGSDKDYQFACGILTRNIGAGNKIPITWPVIEEIDWDDDKTRLSMYKLAIGEVVTGMKRGDPVFQSEFCIGLLTTQLQDFYVDFPHDELRNLVFDESRHHEYLKLGILKQIPFKAIDIPGRNRYYEVKLRFRRPVTTMALSDPWNSPCEHERTGQSEPGKEQNWTTTFKYWKCFFCFERIESQLKSWIMRSPDHAVLVLFTSAEECCVEFQYVDPEDGVSEWTYWWWIELPLEERRELGSTI